MWIAADPKATTLRGPRLSRSTWRASEPATATSWLCRLPARPFLGRLGLTFAGRGRSAATPDPAAWNALRLRREIGRYKATFSLIFRLKWLAASLSLQHATFFVLEHPEDFGAMPKGPRKGQRPATMWQWPQCAELVRKGQMASATGSGYLCCSCYDRRSGEGRHRHGENYTHEPSSSPRRSSTARSRRTTAAATPRTRTSATTSTSRRARGY